MGKQATSSQMDMANRALCYALRNPPPGVEKTKLCDIVKQKLVKKMDGSVPTPGAISEAAEQFMADKDTRGRKEGWRKTSKAEDRAILQKFLHLRPPGHGVDSRMVRNALPKKLQGKACRQTVINRLSEKGYNARKKINKYDFGVQWRNNRVKFARANANRTREQWKSDLQAIGDITEFTYYPKVLQPRFKQLRASWTYMTEEERWKPAFTRPKRWFKGKDYKKTIKFKVFGLTTTTGKDLVFAWPKACTTEKWAALVKKRVIPFLQKEFPSKRRMQLLLDGEKLLHGPAAKALFDAASIKSKLKDWPANSPDINPQEHVWSWAEERLRVLEDEGRGTFEEFQKAAIKAVKDYPSSKKLVPAMASRIQEVIDQKGGPIDR